MTRAPGIPNHKYSEEMAAEVRRLAKGGVSHAGIARILEVSEATIRNHYDKDYQAAVDLANRAVAGVLYDKAMAGDTTSMIFWLKTRARWKEVQQTEITGEGGKPLTLKVIVEK